jgi:hypothetical protein
MVLCIALLVLLAGCSGSKNQNQYANPDAAKYFTGTQGVEAHFVNFPQKLYYYGDSDNAGNEFTFGVEMQNEGASFTRGGVYVSGFDPRMLVFKEIPITGAGSPACGISLGTIGFGQIGGIFQCDGVSIATDGHDYRRVSVKNIGDAIQALSGKHNVKWLDNRFFSSGIDFVQQGDTWNVNFDWSGALGQVEYFQHGRLFIAFFAPLIDFELNKGREFLLAGDTYEWPGGEYAYLAYNGRIANWPPGLDQTDQTFLLTTCYQYTTFADPIVCIDPEPYSENRKVCKPVGKSYSGGNGAPVAITSITQENTPRKIIFHINVKNVGKGTVYDPGQLEKCSPYYPGRVTPEDINIIYLGDVRIGSYGLASRGGLVGVVCSPERIRLDPKKGTGSTTCSVPIEFAEVKSAYQTPLTVELWYGYSQVEEKKVAIKRIV